jgi:hypothetical protein
MYLGFRIWIWNLIGGGQRYQIWMVVGWYVERESEWDSERRGVPCCGDGGQGISGLRSWMLERLIN